MKVHFSTAVSYLGACPPAPLPVLQLLCDTLGDSATEESHQEEQGHAGANHGQDVVLGRRCHHLHGEVRESLRRSHLVEGEDTLTRLRSRKLLPRQQLRLTHLSGVAPHVDAILKSLLALWLQTNAFVLQRVHQAGHLCGRDRRT